MNTRLWVDDERPAPSPEWDVARTSTEALDMLGAGRYTLVSLDHDLGGDDTTRRIVLHWCETGEWPQHVRVHSANPVGVEWLTGMIDRYKP